MNRRQFTGRLAALAATPLMPKTAMASIAAKPSVPLHLFDHPYSWAAFVSRIHNRASPAMFKRHLSLSDDMAQHVYNVLIDEQVISLPNAAGISQALKPFGRGTLTGVTTNGFDPDPATPADASKPTKTPRKSHNTAAEVETTDETDTDSNSVNQEMSGSENDPALPEDTETAPAPDPSGSDRLA